MDYSATLHDNENPAGASPWGNSPGSSPQHHRTSFGPVVVSSPAPPFRFDRQSSSDAPSHEGEEFGGSSFRRPDTASSASATDVDMEESRAESALESQTSLANPPMFGDQQSQRSVEQQRPAGEPLPLGQENQLRKSHQPLFRLQAKITGLERTGKKDPILRFDVHVRNS
jgi:hypothetical protein